MTQEERKRIESSIFEKPKPKSKEVEIIKTEKVLKIAPIVVPFLFCWWSDYLGVEIEVFENADKNYYTTIDQFYNFGFTKICNIPKNVCVII